MSRSTPDLLAEVARMIDRPFRAPISADERAALVVLADHWLDDGRPEGTALVEALHEPDGDPRWTLWRLTEEHPRWCAEVAAMVETVRASGDAEAAARWVSWLPHAVGEPLHAMVAAHLFAMLARVERRELAVVACNPGPIFTLENGWQLEVFVRVYDFWRIDGAIAPGGHPLHLVDYRDETPLGQVNDYEPPPDIESEVYGLGSTPTRRW